MFVIVCAENGYFSYFRCRQKCRQNENISVSLWLDKISRMEEVVEQEYFILGKHLARNFQPIRQCCTFKPHHATQHTTLWKVTAYPKPTTCAVRQQRKNVTVPSLPSIARQFYLRQLNHVSFIITNRRTFWEIGFTALQFNYIKSKRTHVS